MIEVTGRGAISALQTLPWGETSRGEGLCIPPASFRFPIYLGTRRVVLPTDCYYRQQQRSVIYASSRMSSGCLLRIRIKTVAWSLGFERFCSQFFKVAGLA
ncbi:hypothetical protein D9M69_350650 [compost metagenome]